MMNTHVRDNFNETAPAKAVAAGDIFYAVGANAITRLPKGGGLQMLRMNSGATAPEWTNPPAIYVPMVYRMVRTSATDGPIAGYTWVFYANRVPAGYTVYFIIHWYATAGPSPTGTASVALRNITTNTDVWRSTQPAPVSERRERVAVTLTDGHTYQIWGRAERDGQTVEVLQSNFEIL